jgi:hypothetical protein
MLGFNTVSMVVTLTLFSSIAFSAPLKRQSLPCFVTGNVPLATEVTNGLAALNSVTCNNKVQVAPGVPDVISAAISFSSIDFQQSPLSPLGFALSKFSTPTDPFDADLDTFQNQLNVYLAVEAGVRSQPNSSALLGKLKGPKFFLQFQISRIKTALGQTLGVAETVDHQLGKVLKNAPGASADELAQVQALAKVV